MTMSDANEWLQFYHQQNIPPPPNNSLLPSSVSDATAVATTSPQLGVNPEARVSKPIRRRSRASRRTPTTLLNTDTTNFRAMVQQFTGAPFPATPSTASGFPNMGLAFGSRSVHVNPNGLMLAPSASSLQQQQYMHMYGGNNSIMSSQVGERAPPNVSGEGGALMMGQGEGGRFFPATSSS
ncbi:VQ motif-containing protein 22 [Arachis duranensis]|uniref:VQ motif-containing protein 22 n=1 Tax=Arachis duranensis TaxID=130453 RepID=A0A6P4DRI0_ARADU|nr:VQ motif-containing protein 22 [Arachis duranensis]